MEAVAHSAGAAVLPLAAPASRASCYASSTSLGGGFLIRKFSAAGLKRVNFKRDDSRSVVASAKADAQGETLPALASVVADDAVSEVDQPSMNPPETASIGADSSSQALPDMSSDSQPPFQPAPLPGWVAVTIGITVLIAAALFPQYHLGPLEVLRLGLYSVATPQVLQSVLYVGVVLHVLEATYAWYLAGRVDPHNQTLWFWQTLYLGMFSLSILLGKASQSKQD